MSRPVAQSRLDFPHFLTLQTRWADNDIYGHVNNTVYYSYFDTAVNHYLIAQGVLNPAAGELIGLVVENQCNYFSELSFPDTLAAGLRVGHLGTSSVRYEIGLFRGEHTQAAAQGHMVHVYVDRLTRRPAPLSALMRSVLLPLMR